jgi:hypothetical protein
MLDVSYDGKATDQKYEVFEVGEAEDDPEITSVVFETLNLIDQATGGAMAIDQNRPRIILSHGIPLRESPNSGAEGLGFANDQMIYLNTSGLQRVAKEHGGDFHELVSVVLVHELLGHGLERRVMGETGKYFPQHFEYSDEKVAGSVYKSVHAKITPKEGSHEGSRPVREYGQVNPSEDVATSVDSLVAKAMGWKTDKYPRFMSDADEYRYELVMRLMEKAAAVAGGRKENPGFIGSEVRYTTDEQDGHVAVEPARKLLPTTLYGADALRAEVAKQVDKFRPKGTFVIHDENLV